MSFLEELHNKQEANRTSKEEQEWKTKVIPDSVANEISDCIYNYVLNKFKYLVTQPLAYKYDYGLLGIKKNFRYETSFGKNTHHICFDLRKLADCKDMKDVFPVDNGFLGYNYVDSYGATYDEIVCGNLENVEKVFLLVIEKLKEEKIKCIFKITDRQSDCPKLIFQAMIPCDKDGKVIV